MDPILPISNFLSHRLRIIDQLLWLAIGCSILVMGCLGCSPSPKQPKQSEQRKANSKLDLISLPKGFQISIYADNVNNARSMCLGENGTLFVGTRSRGDVYALVDRDQDYQADTMYVLAEDRFRPNGVAFRDGSLYLAEVNKISRWDSIEYKLDNPGPPILINGDFPSETHHGWKYISFGPDDKLYIPVGAPCNVCNREDDPRFASIMRMAPDGTDLEVFAHGVRNSVGFDFHPGTGELWFTDNGRDWLGDDAPNDELNHAPEKGMHFGFPFCHQGDMADPEFGSERTCDQFSPPSQNLGPHVAALGMKFYQGDMFPKRYINSIFIAQHGSWNRDKKIGYRVMNVKLEGDRVTSYEVFAEGWLQNEQAWGRPVDVLELPDGSLLISDDYSNKIYRITYS